MEERISRGFGFGTCSDHLLCIDTDEEGNIHTGILSSPGVVVDPSRSQLSEALGGRVLLIKSRRKERDESTTGTKNKVVFCFSLLLRRVVV